MIRRLARQALAAFTSWRHARRVERANPVAGALKRQIAERASKHRSATLLRRQLRAEVLARLAREQGRTIPERIAS